MCYLNIVDALVLDKILTYKCSFHSYLSGSTPFGPGNSAPLQEDSPPRKHLVLDETQLATSPCSSGLCSLVALYLIFLLLLKKWSCLSFICSSQHSLQWALFPTNLGFLPAPTCLVAVGCVRVEDRGNQAVGNILFTWSCYICLGIGF